MDEKAQDASYQLIRFVLTHLATAGTLDATLAVRFGRWFRFDPFTYVIAHRIYSDPKFLEPTMMRRVDRWAYIDGSDRQSKAHDRRRLKAPPQRTTSESVCVVL